MVKLSTQGFENNIFAWNSFLIMDIVNLSWKLINSTKLTINWTLRCEFWIYFSLNEYNKLKSPTS